MASRVDDTAAAAAAAASSGSINVYEGLSSYSLYERERETAEGRYSLRL